MTISRKTRRIIREHDTAAYGRIDIAEAYELLTQRGNFDQLKTILCFKIEQLIDVYECEMSDPYCGVAHRVKHLIEDCFKMAESIGMDNIRLAYAWKIDK